MVAQVKKYFTKTSDQDWSGIYFNKQPKRSPRDVAGYKDNPDSRDSNPLSNQEESTLVNLFDNVVYANPGFINVTREYVDTNTLVFSYNFQTDENVMTYVYKFQSGANTHIDLSEKNRIFEERTNAGSPAYDIRYELCYANGHVTQISREFSIRLF